MTYHARFWAIIYHKTKFCQVKNRLVLVKRIAKEMCNMRVFVHKSTFLGASEGSKHQNFAFFLHFLVCPKTQLRGRNFPEKKKFFFSIFRFFDKALAHTKCTGGTENGRGINSRCSKQPNSCFF